MPYIQYPNGETYETANPEYHSGAKVISAKLGRELVKQQAKDTLRSMIKPGDRVYTSVSRVSRSGMSRRMSVYVLLTDASGKPYPRNITSLVATAAGFRERDGELVVGGCGMDMGFHVVYSLSSCLFHGDFMCCGEGCPSNDHSNGDRDYSPHQHSDGGYALKQSWL